jgi:hypothetical protein
MKFITLMSNDGKDVIINTSHIIYITVNASRTTAIVTTTTTIFTNKSMDEVLSLINK